MKGMKRGKIGFVIGFIISVILTVGKGYSQENASNPLAAVNNIDLGGQFFNLGNSYLNEYSIDGSYMALPKLKINYGLTYWNTDLTGLKEKGFESFYLKPIFFPLAGEWGKWKYKMAVGIEWIIDFNHTSAGCTENPILCPPYGTGSDQLAPFLGLSFVAPSGTVLIPLVQQYFSYNGPTVNITAVRLIAIQPLPKRFWGKLDFIVPFNWENNMTPSTAEVQLGKMFSNSFGNFVEGLVGIGSDKPYEYGVGVGVRFNY
jgi:hypothetical protein